MYFKGFGMYFTGFGMYFDAFEGIFVHVKEHILVFWCILGDLGYILRYFRGF